MRRLARREYSRDELQKNLVSRGYPVDTVIEVIEDLARSGLQSDSRFAEVFVRSRVGKGYGAHWIKQALRQHGAVEEAGSLNEVDWDERIFRVYTRKYRGASIPSSLPELASRQRFLVGRGFTGDQIRRLFRRLKDGGDA